MSKNNWKLQKQRQASRRHFRYSLRKTTLGVASVLLGTTIFWGTSAAVHADTVDPNVSTTTVSQPTGASQPTAVKQGSATGDPAAGLKQEPAANNHSVVHDGYTSNGQGVTGQMDAQNAASHVVPAQSINLNNYFKENFLKTTNTEQSLKYAKGISANFNQNTYQNDPVAAAEKIDYRNLTPDQQKRINQYTISLVNTVRQQMGFPDYETNPALIKWQQGQTEAQANKQLWGHHPEYLHGAGEDVGAFLINNKIGRPFSQWKPTDFAFKRDPKTHAVVMVTPVGALFTMDDLQAMEYYLTNAYLFEDDGLEANGHGHNLTDWNTAPHTMVALGIAGYHQTGDHGQTEGDQMFNRFIFANPNTVRVAGADPKQNIVAVPNPKTAQQVIHLIDDTDSQVKVPDLVVKNPQGTVLTVTPTLPHGYMLSQGQQRPTRFDFTNGDLPALTMHVQHIIDTMTDARANTQFKLRVHYQADGQTLAPDTLVGADFHRDYTVDEVTGQTSIGDWHYVNGSLKQSGSLIKGAGEPSAPIKGNGTDTFKIWLPFSVPVKGYHVLYTGLVESWSLPTGSGWVTGPENNYTVNYVPDDQQVKEYQDRQITVHFRDDQGKTVADDAVLAVRYFRNKTTYMSGDKKGQTKVSDWNFVGNNYNDDGFSHGMKAISGSWNIPARWNVVSVNVPQVAGYTIDISGGSENINHVPANKFVYPTFDKNVFTSAETVYEAKPEHTIVYHEISNFTVNVVDDRTGQIIGTTGKLVNPNNGSYATMKWNNGLNQNNWHYHVVNVTGVPNGFTLAGNYFHALNDQASFTDLTYPNFRWQSGTNFKGDVMVIHVVPEMINVSYRFLNLDGQVVGQGQLNLVPGDRVDADQLMIPTGWTLASGQVQDLSQQVQAMTANYDLKTDFLVTHQVKQLNVSDLTPTEQQKFGIKASDLHKIVHRVIVIKDAQGKVIKTVTQSANFDRSATVDAVSGQVQYGNWQGNGILPAYLPQPVPEMQTPANVTSKAVSPTDPDLLVTLQYQPITLTGLINYVDENGKTISQAKVSGQTAKLIAPAGYDLSLESNQLSLTTGQQIYNVLVHAKQAAVIANGHRFSQPLTKTVSRTVMIHEANGHVRRVVQKVRFVRTAKVDGLGHEVYGNWRAVGQAQFNKLYLPKRRGYRVMIHDNQQQELTNVAKVMNVSPDMADQVISVSYVKA